MPIFMNPFKKHDVSDFPDTYVPLSRAQRHHSVVSAHGGNLAGLAPGSVSDEKTLKGDDSPKGSTPGGVDERTLEALRAEIDGDVAASGHDSAYDRKSKVINKAIMVCTRRTSILLVRHFRGDGSCCGNT